MHEIDRRPEPYIVVSYRKPRSTKVLRRHDKITCEEKNRSCWSSKTNAYTLYTHCPKKKEILHKSEKSYIDTIILYITTPTITASYRYAMGYTDQFYFYLFFLRKLVSSHYSFSFPYSLYALFVFCSRFRECFRTRVGIRGIIHCLIVTYRGVDPTGPRYDPRHFHP